MGAPSLMATGPAATHPTQWPYVIAAWVITAVVVGVYSVSVLRRGRAFSALVPEGDRRWM